MFLRPAVARRLAGFRSPAAASALASATVVIATVLAAVASDGRANPGVTYADQGPQWTTGARNQF